MYTNNQIILILNEIETKIYELKKIININENINILINKIKNDNDNSISLLFDNINTNFFEFIKLIGKIKDIEEFIYLYLISNPEICNIVDDDNSTLLMCLNIICEKITDESEKIFDLLIEKNENVDIKDDFNCTAIYFVFSNYNDKICHNRLRKLLNKGANFNTCESGKSPLNSNFMEFIPLEIVKILMEYNINPFLEQEDGMSPFKNAILYKRFDIIELFLKNKKYHITNIKLEYDTK